MLLLVAILSACGFAPAPSSVQRPCSTESAYNDLAYALRVVGDVKEACGHVSRPADFAACTGAPELIAVALPDDRCDDLAANARSIHEWTASVAPALSAACRAEPSCLGWASVTKGWGGASILHH